MKSLSLLFSSLFLSTSLFSQVLPYTSVGRGVATTFETDYHCLGINTSALGWGTGYEGKKVTFSTSEASASIYSDSLNKRKFGNFMDIIKTQINNKALDPASAGTILSGAGALAKAGVRVNGEALWIGGSFQNEKFGGIAFSIVESYGFSTKINLNSANVLFQGQWQNLIDSVTVTMNNADTRVAYNSNMSPDSLAAITSAHLTVPLDINAFTTGSSAQVVWNRNYSLGYGRKIFGKDSTFALYGGIGYRYIQAMAYYDMVSDSDGLRVSSSLSPAQLSSGRNLSQINPMNAGSIGGFFSKPVGSGYGIDLSASIIILKKFRMAAAVNNLGLIKYNRYQYVGNTSVSQEIAIENGFDVNNPSKALQELVRGTQILESKGQDTKRVANAANLRLGASWMPIKQLHVGIDMVAPFNKDNATSIQNPIFTLGVDLRPAKWISLNAGIVSGGIYTGNVPMGINFILGNGSYEVGIASRDIVHFLTKNGNGVSTAFGFARLRF
jgi:hypothetical protein|tara:strand:+ start:19103 stop:20596 length:1494 start_codon:yes stop_codon:yes gene_type:complete